MGQVFLSWSHHRSKTFRECPRKWFYQYAHRGEPFERRAELLKTLTSPQMVAGQVVQSSIDDCLFQYKRYNRLSGSNQELLDQALRSFNALIETSPKSIDGMHRDQKPGKNEVALFSDFYKTSLPENCLSNCINTILKCLTNWLDGNTWQAIRETPPTNWMPILRPGNSTRNFNEWRLHGNTIYSPIDFYFYRNSTLHILDWKTGLPGDHGEQLAVYALFATRHLKHAQERVTVQPVELRNSGRFEPRRVSSTEFASMEATILEECAAERARTTSRDTPDGATYFTSVDLHPANPSEVKCRRCNFRRICDCCAALS